MIKSNRYKIFLIAISMLLSSISSFAQVKSEEITEGRDYWMAIPHCKASQDEPVRWGIYPVELWISSKVNTVAKVTSADGTMNDNYAIRANEVKVIAMPDILMNRKSEVVSKKGIRITAKDPISVGVFMAYKWSGEAYRVIPVEWLGRNYVTLNMYQDRTKMHSGETDDKPAQIVIVATMDNTTVTFKPTAETEMGVKPGQTKTVKLMKGETYLIQAKIIPALNQDWSTDLSGTQISANYPIGVISGHTKGAFPRYTASMYGIKADFMRNMLIEMMWPVELLGKEYVSAPIKYTNRPYTAPVAEQEGDIIRFVATEDGTNVYQMRQDGTGLKQICTNLKRGQWYDIIEQKVPAYYKSNKKVLVGQYGKSWLSNLPPPVTEKDVDNPQNPSRNGQGMMLVLAPIERWCSYATFKAPGGMDNFFYMTFTEEDLPKIKLDGQYIKAKYGSQIKDIKGTPYLYIASVISPGDHNISAEDGGRFAGYVYGNYDYSKDGFAYGYPVGINYASFCEDSLYLIDNPNCGDWEATAFSIDLRPDTSCAGILNVLIRDDESENYNFILDEKFVSGNKEAKFWLKVIDKKKYAKATITVMTYSGKSITKTYEYIPEDVIAIPSKIDFGLLKQNDKVCKTFILKNPTKTEVVVKNLKLRKNLAEFQITTKIFPITLKPNQEVTVEVCATALKEEADNYVDFVIAELNCYDKEIDTLTFKTGEPIVWIDDANWGAIPIGVERKKSVEIINQGTVPVVLDKMDWPDKLHFTRVENLTLPLTLQKGQTHTFDVYYIADVPGVVHKTRADFTGNTTKVKLYSDWEGSGITVGPIITPYDWQRKRIIDNKVFVDRFVKANNLKYDDNKGYIGTVDLSAIGNYKLIKVNVRIENDADGVFSFENSEVPQVLDPTSAPSPLTVYFKPKEEKDYQATIVLEGEFNGEMKSHTAILKGTGILPHVNVIGYDYGDLLMGQSKSGDGQVKHVTINNRYAMELTIDELKIEGTHAANFSIDNAWLNSNPYPIVIPVGGDITVPINFTANELGINTAQLVSVDDATDPKDNHRGDLIAKVYQPDLIPSNYDFKKIFKTTTKQGQVWVRNAGSTPVEITRDITASLIGKDVNSFIINGTYIANGVGRRVNNPKAPFTLEIGDTLYVDVTFAPMTSDAYSAEIEYLSDIGTRISKLVGIGQEMYTVASIPKYERNSEGGLLVPGQSVIIDVNYAIQTAKENAKDAMYDKFNNVESGDIRRIKAYVYFKTPSRLEVQDVFPDVKSASDIITAGTMIEGWNIEVADVQPTYLYVKANGNTPLKGNSGTLFKFKMNTFLSDLTDVPLRVDFKIDDQRAYVNIDTIPGKIKVEPVCVNTLRLIKLSGKEFALNQVNPNPVSGSAKIEYSVGFETNTTLELFNSNGDKVATLLNQVLTPGVYEITLDVNQLGLTSGAYFYRMQAGPFEDTKSIIIQK